MSDLVAHQGQKTSLFPSRRHFRPRSARTPRRPTLERLEIQTPFFTVDGQGDVDHGIKVTAAIDLGVFRERFRDWIDLGGIVLAGKGKSRVVISVTERISMPSRRRVSRSCGSMDAHGRQGQARPIVPGWQSQWPSASSGWPADWRDISLQAVSGPAGSC